jgi:hypothetical protein
MGTDNVELLDRRTAEVIVRGAEVDLITLLESRTRPLAAPPVWRDYWDAGSESIQEFPRETTLTERLRVITSGGREMVEIKHELIRELCTSDWLHLDYWGCKAGVFGPGDPPGSTTWEDFISPMFPGAAPEPPVHHDDDGSVLWVETSGRYLLTSANTEAMILSLRSHSQDVTVMSEADVAKLERWHGFCMSHPDFCVVYQIDY